MDFNNLTDEQKAKAKNASSPEEILELAQEEGVELSVEDLDAASGGWGASDDCNGDPDIR